MPAVSQIGGSLFGGGWINQSDIFSVVSGTAPWSASYQSGIPIRQCHLLQRYQEEPLRISGLLGAATSRRMAFQGVFSFNIWFDQDNPIEVAGTAHGGPVPSFRQRDPFQLVFLAGYDPKAAAFLRAYYAPRAVADAITPIWDEESDPRRVIGMEVAGHTRGWTFLLPDDGIPNDSTTLVGAYLYYLANGGLGLI